MQQLAGKKNRIQIELSQTGCDCIFTRLRLFGQVGAIQFCGKCFPIILECYFTSPEMQNKERIYSWLALKPVFSPVFAL